VIDLAVVLTAFALILPAELPDKTFIATLVLATRLPRLWVWLGAISAFAVQVLIAVTAGGLLTLLPERIVLGASFALFAAGAVIMLRGGLAGRAAQAAQAQAEEAEEAEDLGERLGTGAAVTRRRAFLITFGVLFTAEFGDLSQLLTAGLAASSGAPASVFLGSWLALAVVSGTAVLAGNWLRQRVPVWRLRLVSAAILIALAAWTAWEFVAAG
jgi:putative Ca2+/H+ antiporter (TMEM165/GDT1 family)